MSHFAGPLKIIKITSVLALGLWLQGCSTTPSLPSVGSTLGSLGGWFGGSGNEYADPENVTPAGQLYNEGDALLNNGKYLEAATKFEEVDRLHPYSPFARRSIVMAAYAHYKNSKFPEATAAAKRYTTLHPGTKEAALAQHIIAMSYYDQIADPNLDQVRTKKALKSLEELVRRYPDSRYTPQAHNRIRVARDVLAASEMSVGRYYQKKHNHLAAINRFKTVVREYQTTKHVEEALARLAESYMTLGIASEAQTAAAILGHNFPNSPWYKDTYVLLQSGGLAPREDTGSWLSKSWKNAVKTAQGWNPVN